MDLIVYYFNIKLEEGINFIIILVSSRKPYEFIFFCGFVASATFILF